MMGVGVIIAGEEAWAQGAAARSWSFVSDRGPLIGCWQSEAADRPAALAPSRESRAVSPLAPAPRRRPCDQVWDYCVGVRCVHPRVQWSRDQYIRSI